MGEIRNLYVIAVDKPEGTKSFLRLRRRRENNIKTHLHSHVERPVVYVTNV
jgi:hypothetical protein